MSRPEFKDSKFMSAKQKEKVLGHWHKLLALIAKQGLPDDLPPQFTNDLYQHLIMHCGHIAHYDRSGFWCAQLGTAQRALEFITGLGRNLTTLFGAQRDYSDINSAMHAVLQHHLPALQQALRLEAREHAHTQILAMAKAAGVSLADLAEREASPGCAVQAFHQAMPPAAAAAPARCNPVVSLQPEQGMLF